MVLGDAVSKLETSVWILNHISKSITWSLLAPEMYTTKETKRHLLCHCLNNNNYGTGSVLINTY